MSDLISRAALIDRVLEYVKTERSTMEIKRVLIPLIKNFPAAKDVDEDDEGNPLDKDEIDEIERERTRTVRRALGWR